MNHKRYLLLCSLVVGMIVHVFGQAPVLQSFGGSSTAQTVGAGRYNNSNVNTRTGSNVVTLPLYSVSTGGVSIPVALSYNGRGIRVEQQASFVGLGWNLSFGGVITREVKGHPDFTINAYDFATAQVSSWTPDFVPPANSCKEEDHRLEIAWTEGKWECLNYGGQFYRREWDIVNTFQKYHGLGYSDATDKWDVTKTFPDDYCGSQSGFACADHAYKIFNQVNSGTGTQADPLQFGDLFDSEPDVFNLRLGGHNVRFVYDVAAKTFKQIDYSNLKIEFELGAVPANPNDQIFQGASRDIISFTVTDVNGNQYIFGKAEATEVENLIPRTSSPDVDRNNTFYTSAWYLTKVITPSSKEITLEYLNNKITYVNRLQRRDGIEELAMQATNVHQALIHRIKCPLVTLEFEYQSGREDLFGGRALTRMRILRNVYPF